MAGVTSASVRLGHWWVETLLLFLLAFGVEEPQRLMAPTAQGNSNGRGTEIKAPTWGLFFLS